MGNKDDCKRNKDDCNRSVRKTEAGIKRTFLELMKEKHYSNIHVKDIVETLDISRATFYLHFQDIYDLLDKIEDEIIVDVSDAIRGIDREGKTTGKHPKHIKLFQAFDRHRNEFAILMGSNGDMDFLLKLTSAIEGAFHDAWSMYDIRDEAKANLDMYITYITYGIIGIVQNEIKTDAPLDAEKMGMFAGAVTNWIDEALVQGIYGEL